MATTIKIMVPKRRVHKNTNGFYVIEVRRQGIARKRWIPISREYEHKTSADAALGRMVQRETEESGEDS